MNNSKVKDVLGALADLGDILPDLEQALEESYSRDEELDATFRNGILEAADLIEGYFLAGKARRYATDEDALCRLLTNALREKADEG